MRLGTWGLGSIPRRRRWSWWRWWRCPPPRPRAAVAPAACSTKTTAVPSAYPNEPALAIGLISGSGLRRRSARLATLDQDFSSNAYDFADGGAEQRFRRQTRPGIVSPFGQTSDVEDEHRLRRADEGAAGGEDAAKLAEGSGQQEADVDGAHFPAQRRQNDGEDDLEQDSAVDRRRRGVADDEDDVYRDLDDPALPSWARGRAVAKRQAEDPVLQEDFLAEDDDEPVMLWARDSDRARRQVGEDLLTTPDSDEADYLRQRREEGAATTTEVSTATDGVTETEASEVSSAPRDGGSEATTSASDVADKQAAPAVERETTATPGRQARER
ncbi:2,3-bisphosphoglycerate-independent phosphoglycerate mutase [Frankliniella fusca]|uniref:2,3-bisphosphoglycerate-independent phosphoglycerate mutase n=1 Tax=Frankliniella fusca TaxID=407009 RepID=A0AAE1HY66_9NEOP|nr:2,3-bisphosphoglycerate-independent phosphoglycerate mutase [Frankliniella fusca]